MKNLEKTIDTYLERKIINNVAIRIGKSEEVLYDTFRGNVNEHTLFDMASVTKIIATTPLALIALDKGLLKLDDSVKKFYNTDKEITIKNLLTHTMGIGHKALNLDGNTYENIAEKILEIPSDFKVGSEVSYSCPGFILLGKILEKVFGQRLDKCFETLVAKPLNMLETSFLPKNKQDAVNSNPKEQLRGVVNDYNCQFLGGVAGNAGVFSNILDATKYVKFLLDKGNPLICESTFDVAAKNYTKNLSESRGLGFLYVDEKFSQTGNLFENGAIGHCGHTGQSLFVDYKSGLYVIILTDATVSTINKYGNEHYDEVIKMREDLHNAINCDLNNL